MKDEIKEVFDEMMDDDEIKEIIHQNLKQAVKDSISSVIKNGEVGRRIKNEIEKILIKQIEDYNFDNHIIKLDSILTDIMNTTVVADNKKILENFRYIMTEPMKKELKISEIFEEYKKFVKSYIDIEEDTEEKTKITVGLRIKKRYTKSSLTFIFYVEEDTELERKYIVTHTDNQTNKVFGRSPIDIMSLRYMPRFDLFMEKIIRQYTNVIIDTDYIEEVIEIENE